MYGDTPVLDVHGHVSHPWGGMGQQLLFMQAQNAPMASAARAVARISILIARPPVVSLPAAEAS